MLQLRRPSRIFCPARFVYTLTMQDAHTNSGRSCVRPGVYRSNDCGYEITLRDGEQFPECTEHKKAVTWTFIKALELATSIPQAEFHAKSAVG